MIIEKNFSFDAAHFLPNVPEGHKCRRMHGHTYHVSVAAKGELTGHEQWVMDFGDIKKVVAPVIDSLDHQLLNAIAGLENPTAEVIAIYIYNKIRAGIPGLYYVSVQETPTARCIYYGEAEKAI